MSQAEKVAMEAALRDQFGIRFDAGAPNDRGVSHHSMAPFKVPYIGAQTFQGFRIIRGF